VLCTSSRYLVVGGVAALVAVVLGASDVVGLLVLVVVAAALAGAERVWPRLRGRGSCAVALPHERAVSPSASRRDGRHD
jgi:hypothetical protein